MSTTTTRNELYTKIAAFVTIGLIFFMSIMAIATAGLFAKIDKEDKEFQDKMEAYDAADAEREAVREAEIAEVKRELSQSFYAPAIVRYVEEPEEEENETETEPKIKEPLFVILEEVPENLEETKEVETELVETEPEVDTKLEIDSKFDEQSFVIVEEISKETKIENETEDKVKETVEDTESKTNDWFEVETPEPQTTQQKVEEVVLPTPSIKTVEVPVSQSTPMHDDDDVPLIYSLEEFYSWNGIDREYFIVTLSRVVYVESRGTCREGKVSVAATIVNWARSGLITNLWDILSGYAPIDSVDYYQLIWDPEEGPTMKLCREAAEAAVNGEDPAGDMMGAHSFYFLDPAKANPYHANIMMQAYHQVWTEPTQLFCGYRGVKWP
jgi:hypothetical protein